MGDANEVYAGAVQRIVKARNAGKGVRLSALECQMMGLDMASWDCVIAPKTLAEMARQGSAMKAVKTPGE